MTECMDDDAELCIKLGSILRMHSQKTGNVHGTVFKQGGGDLPPDYISFIQSVRKNKVYE